jgi:hypothetical protein
MRARVATKANATANLEKATASSGEICLAPPHRALLASFAGLNRIVILAIGSSSADDAIMVATGTALAGRAWRWLLFPAKPRAKYAKPCAKRGAQQLPRGPHERHKNEGVINAQQTR